MKDNINITYPGKEKYMSKVNYRPYGKLILVAIPEREKVFFGKNNLIDPNSLSDKERINLGISTKSADIANKSSEEQTSYIVVAVGNKVDTTEVNIGDEVVFKPAVQSFTVEVNGEIYIEVEEFWIAGILTNK